MSVTELEGQVAEVILHLQGATVTREITTSLKAGKQRLVFHNIPASITDTSVLITSPDNINLGLAQVKRQRIEISQTPEYAELEAAILSLERKITHRERLLADLEVEREFAQSLAKQPIGSNEKALSQQQLSDRLTLIQKTMGQALQQKGEIESELETLSFELKQKKEQLQKLGGKQRQQVDALVEVNVPVAGRYKLKVSYYSPRANWQPRYQLMAYPDKKQIELQVEARVTQTTGESWDNALLTLNNQRPGHAGPMQPPEPKPQYLDYPAQYRAKSSRQAELSMAPMRADKAAAQEESQSFSQVQQAAYVVNWELGKKTVPSSQESNFFAFQGNSIAAQFSYQILGYFNDAAYLVGKAKNPFDFTLPAGKTVLTIGNNTVGSGFLEEVAQGQLMTIGFGKDPAVEVERKRLRYESESGFTQNSRLVHYQLRITNHHQDKVSLEVMERIPLARGKDIEVSNELADNWQHQGQGIYATSVIALPKKTVKLDIRYEIEWPKNLDEPVSY